MQLELNNSNHNSDSKTSESASAPVAAVAAGKAVIVASYIWDSVIKDAAAIREMRALARAGLLDCPNVTKPARLWTVREMAKQIGMSESRVRRHARKWAFTRCVAHFRCRGGTRGCNLRFVAEDAMHWLDVQRQRRAGR
jgi:AraC-like DNA-binding protein